MKRNCARWQMISNSSHRVHRNPIEVYFRPPSARTSWISLRIHYWENARLDYTFTGYKFWSLSVHKNLGKYLFWKDELVLWFYHFTIGPRAILKFQLNVYLKTIGEDILENILPHFLWQMAWILKRQRKYYAAIKQRNIQTLKKDRWFSRTFSTHFTLYVEQLLKQKQQTYKTETCEEEDYGLVGYDVVKFDTLHCTAFNWVRQIPSSPTTKITTGSSVHRQRTWRKRWEENI